MKKGTLIFLIAVVALSFCSRPASALVILDPNFFSGTTHIVITFETDGLGNKLKIAEGQSKPMPADEYAHYGFTFEPDISWVNDAGTAFDEAQIIGGTPKIGIESIDQDDFTINMSFPTRAFGFWVINYHTPDFVVTLEAYGDDGLIEEVTFEGDAIDGIVIDRALDGNIEYGFLGIASEKFITSIHVTKGATMLDNFTYSPIPEPATVILLGLGCLVLLRKRRA
jgi:hypothetical protein